MLTCSSRHAPLYLFRVRLLVSGYSRVRHVSMPQGISALARVFFLIDYP